MVEENFDGPSYAKLRSRRPAESAVDMARTSDVAALRILLVHHWFEIAQQYLSVISSFPETTSPIDYRYIIFMQIFQVKKLLITRNSGIC